MKKLILLLLLNTASSFCYGATNFFNDANCMGGYDMNIDENPITDSSGEGHTGALTGADSPNYITPAKYDGGYDFDGADDQINTGDISEMQVGVDLSWVGWANLDDLTSGDDYMIACLDDFGGGGMVLFKDDVSAVSGRTDCWRVTVYDASDGDSGTLETPTNGASTGWTHIAVTADLGSATGLRLYINGSETADSPVDISAVSTIDSSPQNTIIGNTDADNNREFAGLIDEVGYFNRVLSSVEINNIMNDGLDGSQAVVVGGGGAIPQFITW